MKTSAVLRGALPAWVLLASVALPAAASPTLVGDQVTINGLYPDASTVEATTTVTVGAGAEVTCPSGPLCLAAGGSLLVGESIDLDALSISGFLWRGFNVAVFDGFEFLGLDFGSGYQLTGFSLTTDVIGLDVSDVSFTSNSLRINLQGTTLPSPTGGGSFRIDLQTNSLTVPEPATLALGALGLLSVGMTRRRRIVRR